MGYFSQLDAELAEEDLGPDPYDEHVDACAHLPKHIWNLVRHLPTALAVSEGETMMKREQLNKDVVESIWGKREAV